MRSDRRILKYLTHDFPEGTKLRKCALPENAESGKCDVKTGLSIDNWQLIIDSGQLSPCRHIPHAARQLSIVHWKAVVSFCQNVKWIAWECPRLHQNTSWWPGKEFSGGLCFSCCRGFRQFPFLLSDFSLPSFPSVRLFTRTDAISHIGNRAPLVSKKWGQVPIFVRTNDHDGADTSVRR